MYEDVINFEKIEKFVRQQAQIPETHVVFISVSGEMFKTEYVWRSTDGHSDSRCGSFTVQNN